MTNAQMLVRHALGFCLHGNVESPGLETVADAAARHAILNSVAVRLGGRNGVMVKLHAVAQRAVAPIAWRQSIGRCLE